MSLTSNFDFCVELGIRTVKEIFHLAFKQEDLYPHNVGPFTRTYGGQTITIHVRVLDDETNPADLSFQDATHIAFSFPFEIQVEAPDSPDPSLSHITMRAQVTTPSLLTSWAEDSGDVLGLSFADLTAADVQVDSLEGLPTIGEQQFRNSVHAKYLTIPHTYTQGPNRVNLYDGNRDLSLDPPYSGGSSEIQVTLETHSGQEYLKLVLPIYVHAEQGALVYDGFGTATSFRAVTRTTTTISVAMTAEPGDAALATVVALVPHITLVESTIKPYVIQALAQFSPIEEPAPDQNAAEEILRSEVATYLQPLRFPVYSPQSGDEAEPVSTPVGFLLPDDGVLAILLNRRDATVADSPPDNFLGSLQLSVAVGRAKVDEEISQAINDEFPGVNNGGHEVETDEGSATLNSLSVAPENPDEHDVDRDHLWASGEAEVHIDCWPDPDVSFEGPVFLNATAGTDDEGRCTLEIQAEAGDFDIDESCCDVFLDLLIPIVGWIMLAIVESTIDRVGGAVIEDIAAGQERAIAPIPPSSTASLRSPRA